MIQQEHQNVVKAVEGFMLTTAIKKLRTLRKRRRVIPGSSSAGKTYGILPLLIDHAIKHERSEISVVSESIPHLRKGAMKDFLKIMMSTNRYVDENWNRTLLIYTFSNGSYIEFFSADMDDKVRGPRRHVLYINECNNLPFETYHQLAIRTSEIIWLDFNPANEFWAYTELKEDEDTEWLTLTYKDNEALPDSIRKEIEKARTKAYHDPEGNIFDEKNIKNNYWNNWWKVYGLGMLGSLEGVIFGNWTIIPSVPEEAKLIGCGLDFGYTNDPTALTEIYALGDKRVVNQAIYRTGLLSEPLAALLPRGVKIWADSATPSTIDEVKAKDSDILIEGVAKPKGSIVYGIQLMQQQDYLITADSVDLIKELRRYSWAKDKYGNKLNVPAGGFDHCFTGDTPVYTSTGQKRIDSILPGEQVLTREGFKKVLKRWDNGYKSVKTYCLQFDTFSVNLRSTEEHKVYTNKGWKAISKLEPGMIIMYIRPTKELSINYIREKDIFPEVSTECTLLCGRQRIRKRFQKDTTYTTLTVTGGTISQIILVWWNKINIYLNTAREGTERIKSGLKNFTTRVLELLSSGILVKKVGLGTQSTQKSLILVNPISQKKNASTVKYYSNLKSNILNSVATTVNLPTERAKELITLKGSVFPAGTPLKLISIQIKTNAKEDVSQVYDLTIEDKHEYYAAGILVHNCIDSLRYHEMGNLGKPEKEIWFGW